MKDQKQIGESAEYFCVYTALSDNKFVMLECPWLASWLATSELHISHFSLPV